MNVSERHYTNRAEAWEVRPKWIVSQGAFVLSGFTGAEEWTRPSSERGRQAVPRARIGDRPPGGVPVPASSWVNPKGLSALRRVLHGGLSGEGGRHCPHLRRGERSPRSGWFEWRRDVS